MAGFAVRKCWQCSIDDGWGQLRYLQQTIWTDFLHQLMLCRPAKISFCTRVDIIGTHASNSNSAMPGLSLKTLLILVDCYLWLFSDASQLSASFLSHLRSNLSLPFLQHSTSTTNSHLHTTVYDICKQDLLSRTLVRHQMGRTLPLSTCNYRFTVSIRCYHSRPGCAPSAFQPSIYLAHSS